jgi:hypothetical protein
VLLDLKILQSATLRNHIISSRILVKKNSWSKLRILPPLIRNKQQQNEEKLNQNGTITSKQLKLNITFRTNSLSTCSAPKSIQKSVHEIPTLDLSEPK